MRYHLGLRTANSFACRLYVDGIPYVWRDGEDVLFDETYVHTATNESDVPRIILFCDVTRPLRTRLMRGVNAFMIRHVVGHTASRNEADEPLGAVNGVARSIHAAGEFFHRIKKRTNRRLYYALKYALYAALVYLLLFSGLLL